MSGETDIEQVRTLLDWYDLAGVDEAIGEEPVDRFTTPSPAPFRLNSRREQPSNARQADHDRLPQATEASRADKTALPPLQGHPLSQGDTVQAPAPARSAVISQDPISDARNLAATAQTLAELEVLVREFDGCPLKKTAKSTCFADGSAESGVMFIGEAPGRDEDHSGTPFIGRAGQLLDKMLAAIGRDRTSAYITNIVYWRPPGNRNPTPTEAAICQPFIERQIAFVQPKLLVFLGGAAAKQMLNTTTGIMRLRGKWNSYTLPVGEGVGEPIPSIATLHPAFLLRQPGQKKLAWNDFQLIRKALDDSA